MVEDKAARTALRRAQKVLDRFLANRNAQTRRFYRTDIEEFARFLSLSAPEAVARLVKVDRAAAHRIVVDYVVDLRRRDRAQATIDRRIATLRTLIRAARDDGLIDWLLAPPSEAEIEGALEQLPARDSEHYLFPRHPSEIDRLDIQHHALRETLDANFLAPVQAAEHILDVGCGTGQWAFEVCDELAPRLAVGLDLVAGKPQQPEQYRFVRGNVLQGLPFADGQFDFVHQRLLVPGVPLQAWPSLISELVRVTRPGGWIELVDTPFRIERGGPNSQRLMELTKELVASLGLDTEGVVHGSLDSYLRASGMVEVGRHDVSVPVGDWGGDVGSLMVTDSRTGATRVCEVLQARGRLSAWEAHELIGGAQEEWQHGEMAYPFGIAWGQKPG